MTTTQKHTLKISRTFDAERERVFKAFTDPSLVPLWWGPPGYTVPLCEMDVREGGSYRVGMKGEAGDLHHLRGEFREIKPHDRLVYTFIWEEGDHADLEMLVTLEFLDSGAGTEVKLTQEGLPSEKSRADHEGGWYGSFDRLVVLVEN